MRSWVFPYSPYYRYTTQRTRPDRRCSLHHASMIGHGLLTDRVLPDSSLSCISCNIEIWDDPNPLVSCKSMHKLTATAHYSH